MKPLRAVFFDLVGTLIHVAGSVGAQYARVAADFGIEADAAALDRVFPGVLRTAPAIDCTGRSFDETAALERAQWCAIVRQVFELCGSRAAAEGGRPFERYFDALFSYFATAAPWHVYADAAPALERARRAGLRLGLVTNFDHRVFPLIEALGLAGFFDVVAIPGVAGSSKPAPGIFHYATGVVGVAPDDAAHVGDSSDEDARAAAAAGLHAIWLDRSASGTPPPGITRVTSLRDLDW